jgi:hypothetical protein
MCAVTWGGSVGSMMLIINIDWNLIRFYQMNVNIFKNLFINIRYGKQIVQIIIALSFALSCC